MNQSPLKCLYITGAPKYSNESALYCRGDILDAGLSNKEEQWVAGLARRMISGDRDAFDELMKQFYPGLLRAAYLIAGNRADSEDIVQETFAACWAGRMRIRDPEHIGKWLYKTMTREAWRTGRRGRREQPVEEVFSEDTPSGYSVLDEVVSASGKQELLKAIAALPVKQRTVLVLYYYNDMSAKEIASVMGCLEGTVKSRLFTARKNLKTALMARDAMGEEALL